MALTRKFLKAMGIDDEKIDEIVSAHSDTVAALKETAEQYRADAEKLPGVQKELDAARKAAEESGKDPFKVKYEALKEDFETYKTEQTAKETKSAKTAAYRALLKEAGVSEKRVEAVLKVVDVDGIELDGDKVKDADKLKESIKTDWAEFITTPGETGASVETPPATTPAAELDKLSDADYYKTVMKKE